MYSRLVFRPHTDVFFWADVETNECLTNNGGCWQDKTANITACKVFLSSLNKLSNNRVLQIFNFLCSDLIMLSIFSGYIPWTSM